MISLSGFVLTPDIAAHLMCIASSLSSGGHSLSRSYHPVISSVSRDLSCQVVAAILWAFHSNHSFGLTRPFSVLNMVSDAASSMRTPADAVVVLSGCACGLPHACVCCAVRDKIMWFADGHEWTSPGFYSCSCVPVSKCTTCVQVYNTTQHVTAL